MVDNRQTYQSECIVSSITISTQRLFSSETFVCVSWPTFVLSENFSWKLNTLITMYINHTFAQAHNFPDRECARGRDHCHQSRLSSLGLADRRVIYHALSQGGNKRIAQCVRSQYHFSIHGNSLTIYHEKTFFTNANPEIFLTFFVTY